MHLPKPQGSEVLKYQVFSICISNRNDLGRAFILGYPARMLRAARSPSPNHFPAQPSLSAAQRSSYGMSASNHKSCHVFSISCWVGFWNQQTCINNLKLPRTNACDYHLQPPKAPKHQYSSCPLNFKREDPRPSNPTSPKWLHCSSSPEDPAHCSGITQTEATEKNARETQLCRHRCLDSANFRKC